MVRLEGNRGESKMDFYGGEFESGGFAGLEDRVFFGADKETKPARFSIFDWGQGVAHWVKRDAP
jgi:hypothetical protein